MCLKNPENERFWGYSSWGFKKHYHRTVIFRKTLNSGKMVSKMFVLCYPLVGVSWSYLMILALYFSCVGQRKKHQNSPTKSSEVSVAREVTKSHLPAWKIRRFEHLKNLKRKMSWNRKTCIFLKETNFRMSKNQRRKKTSYSLELFRAIFYGLYHGIDHHEKPQYVSKSIKQSQIYEEKTKKTSYDGTKSHPSSVFFLVPICLRYIDWSQYPLAWLGCLVVFHDLQSTQNGENRWKWGWL